LRALLPPGIVTDEWLSTNGQLLHHCACHLSAKDEPAMPAAKTALDLEFPLALERAARSPLHRQLREHLRGAILDGRLAAGTRLPSTRTLARLLRVTRTVTCSAYDELVAEGYLEARPGSGTYVGRDLPAVMPARRPVSEVAPRWLAQAPAGASAPPEALVPDVPHAPFLAHTAHTTQDDGTAPRTVAFRLGMPSVSSLPPRIWREAWRPVTRRLPPDGYSPPDEGEWPLRCALAPYLGRSRGLACTAEDILITAGATHALDLIARACLAGGAAAAVEDPGHPAARHVLLTRGGRVIPVPVDEDGLRVEQLPQGAAAPPLVYTTPSHQYPLGGRLSGARRLALLAWAEATDSLIVEDDYDSEFRFDSAPLPALASLDGAGRVAYVGTFSKVLTPALRVGYLVAPPPLRRRVAQLQYLTYEYVPWPLQQMLATFIAHGHLERHIRRMRQRYAQHRRALAQALVPVAHLARLRGLEAGMHACLELHPRLDAALVVRRARGRGVLVTPLDAYYVGVPDRSGLLLGYGSLDIPDIIHGATILREVIEQVSAMPHHA
jgi:GntR family transcriptional regulator / MocR family aminotransferase